MPDTIDLSEVVRVFEIPSAPDRRKKRVVDRSLRIEVLRLASGRFTAAVYERSTFEVPISLPFTDTKGMTAWTLCWDFWHAVDFYGQLTRRQAPETATEEEALAAVREQLAVMARG
jgi:hypothetical protein